MSSNSFGRIFSFSSFGESHGPAIGGVVDGCPAGLAIDLNFIQAELKRRRPGQSSLATQRNEADAVEILSGLLDGKSTGAPIGFIIRNLDQRSTDYSHLEQAYRPSHADYTYEQKYGIRDHRGGGRSSARETAVRIVAGAIAKIFLKHHGITINAFVKQIGEIKLEGDYSTMDLKQAEQNPVRCPDPETAQRMQTLLEAVKKEGDTLGGIVHCVASGLPTGLGEPVYDKLSSRLAQAMLSINAVKGFEIGSGFEGCTQRGSMQNDLFRRATESSQLHTKATTVAASRAASTMACRLPLMWLSSPVPRS